MYSREKQFRQENQKPKKSHRNTPSFSSSLLDEICRSIDDKPEPKTASGFRARSSSKRDDETKCRVVDKWMENEKTVFRRRPIKCVFPDNDDFSTSRRKPVRTDRLRERDSYLFDDYEEHERNRDQMKSPKSRALKFYANLKKMKQPISPGARLTNFINSIFNRKKSKSKSKPKPRDNNNNDHRKTAAAEKISDRRIVGDRDEAMPRGGRWSAGDGRPPLPPNAFRNSTRCHLGNERDDDDDSSDEDALSESSSDLFELDHLSFGHKDMFSELPVYETTVFHRNCRFIR